MSVAHIGKLQENTTALCKIAAKSSGFPDVIHPGGKCGSWMENGGAAGLNGGSSRVECGDSRMEFLPGWNVQDPILLVFWIFLGIPKNSPQSRIALIQGEWKTRDVKLRPYHAHLELLVRRFDDLRYTHLPRAQNQFADALTTLASMIDIPIDATVRLLLIESRSVLTYCCLIDDTELDDGVCGPHMGGHMLARKIMRTSYFWLTMKMDCCQFVQRCVECQIHEDLIHVPSSELHVLMSPWPFLVWGIDIIGKISPKSLSGHEFILVTIDYFTKWVEVASYARLTSSRVASFIRSHIICHYGVSHELISDKGPQKNRAIEAANKNIKRILRKMIETSRDWSEKLSFALWAYQTSFRTSTGAIPYSLVYGMKVVLPVEIETGSLRVALKQQIPEVDWAQARLDQLNLLDERRLRVADHVIGGLIRDPRGKFRPNWSGPYFIRELALEGTAWLMDLDGNQFLEPTNVDKLKRGTFFSLSFPITAPLHFHLISLVVFFISSSLSYLLLVLFHILSTLSGDPSQFIT
ncbi:hypothetical protein CK203_054459 [Vitis vinifera]|uniref:Integrase catalytic domain-containing protein n=1 Tax=Vitis vinifera TaxID=29760 RepID=A0A438GZV6_VITVI|nr:hypothetical protein CK203_054459 [Vitis vinifera]